MLHCLCRDGSAVELVGLCKSTVRWLHLMYEHGKYPYRGVEKLEDGKKVFLGYVYVVCYLGGTAKPGY